MNMTETAYDTKEKVCDAGLRALGKRLRDMIPSEEIPTIERRLIEYKTDRKGYFGDLVEEYVFGMKPNARAEADFPEAGVELKTSPIKGHPRKTYVAKERLVFSMIDYKAIIHETWDESSFLAKNKVLLLMFYLYAQGLTLIDYEFKFVHLLDLLSDIDANDIAQIRRDWEFIVAKIRRKEAHLLSEGDTYYLGACTKARDSKTLRAQEGTDVKAKPRAFALKQTYLNYLIQTRLLGRQPEAVSIYAGRKRPDETIESIIGEKLAGFIGMTDTEIRRRVGWKYETSPKNYKRLLANMMLSGSPSNHIEELEKADVTLKTVVLEANGHLKESMSFPAFDYVDLLTQPWYDEDSEEMADFHAQLERKRFLFMVFRKKAGSDEIVFEKHLFWNFPAEDLGYAQEVFERAKECIRAGTYDLLPKSSENPVAHVRTHGRDARDTLTTPQKTQEPKRCFWLNADYIRKVVS